MLQPWFYHSLGPGPVSMPPKQNNEDLIYLPPTIPTANQKKAARGIIDSPAQGTPSAFLNTLENREQKTCPTKDNENLKIAG